MEDNIDSFWEDRPKEKVASGSPAPGVGDELLDDWLDAHNLPKVFYQVVKGYGINYMAIRQIKCVGQSQKERPKHRGGECYIGIFEKNIWAGSKYKEREQDAGKRFAYSKANSFLTLEAAIIQFNVYQKKYIEESEERAKQWERSARDLLESTRKQREENALAATFDVAKAIEDEAQVSDPSHP